MYSSFLSEFRKYPTATPTAAPMISPVATLDDLLIKHTFKGYQIAHFSLFFLLSFHRFSHFSLATSSLSAFRKNPTTAPTAVPTTKAAMAFDDLVMTQN